VRLPAGHPEGYLEGFATTYREVACAIRGDADAEMVFPTVADGVLGVRFIAACVESSSRGGWWVPLQ